MVTTQVQEETTAAYRKRVMGFLGNQDPLEVLGGTAEVLGEVVRANGKKRMQARPFEGKWTPCEVLGHLCDCEWVYGYRTRLILCEKNPTILGMDQDLWVTGSATTRSSRWRSPSSSASCAPTTCACGRA